MGVRGLYSYVVENKCYKLCNIIADAKDQQGIEILIDFNSFMRDFIELLSKKMAEKYDNTYLLFPGGEFDKLYNAIYDFHKSFQAAKIKFVWIIDGPKGVDQVASEQKRVTWNQREIDDIRKYDEVLFGCRVKLPPSELNNLVATCSFEIAIEALKDAGAEVIQLLQGESDEFIAYTFLQRNSYAIISNDSDFLIFRNCKVIFIKLMNIAYEKNDFKLPFFDNENPETLFKKPEKFRCPIVSQEQVLRLFNFSTYDQMVVLSIIKGNDNTNEFAQELQINLKITNRPNRNPHVSQIANYIRNYSITMGNIKNLPAIKNFARTCPKLMTAIDFCKGFYSLQRIIGNINQSMVRYDPLLTTNPLTDFMAQKLSQAKLWKGLYACHHGTFTDSVVAERLILTCNSISSILSEIRFRLYPYILHERLNEVTEWRSRCNQELIRIPVKHAKLKANNIRDQRQHSKSTLSGIVIFEEIWSHLEQNGPMKYFDNFGIESGFICYTLRYFYLITKNKNLKVSSEEFRALFVSVFYCYSESQKVKFSTRLNRESFLRMKICPSERCFIIDAWFLRILQHALYLCGGALNLFKRLPSLRNVFSGSVLYGFYENIMNDHNQRTTHLYDSLQNSIRSLEEQVLKKFDEQYYSIIE